MSGNQYYILLNKCVYIFCLLFICHAYMYILTQEDLLGINYKIISINKPYIIYSK